MSPHQRQTVRNPYLRSLRWRRFKVPSTLRFGATSDQAHPILDLIFHRRVWLTMAPKVMLPGLQQLNTPPNVLDILKNDGSLSLRPSVEKLLRSEN